MQDPHHFPRRCRISHSSHSRLGPHLSQARPNHSLTLSGSPASASVLGMQRLRPSSASHRQVMSAGDYVNHYKYFFHYLFVCQASDCFRDGVQQNTLVDCFNAFCKCLFLFCCMPSCRAERPGEKASRLVSCNEAICRLAD